MKIEDVKYIIIHSTRTVPKKGMAGVKEEHLSQGRLGCGYHFVIDREGTVHIGRPLLEAGCHARGYNECSIGIGLIGGLNGKNDSTPLQMASLRCLCNTMSLIFKTAQVKMHRELDKGAGLCPVCDVKL